MSSDAHLTREDILSLLSGAPGSSNLSQSVPHLLRERCAVCLRAWQEAEEELAVAAGALGPAEAPLDQALARHREMSVTDKRNWLREMRQLLDAPRDRQLAMVARATKRYRSPLTAFELLERSRQAMPEEPSEAEHFARLAHAVASRNPESGHLGLEALACMHVANAQRALGRTKQADSLTESARLLAARFDVRDPVVLAELDEYEGLIRRHEERFEDAAFLFTAAIGRYRRYGRRLRLIHSLTSLATVEALQSEFSAARQTLTEALDLIDRHAEAELYLYSRHNLVLYLCEAGEHAEARRVFEDTRPLYGSPPGRWLALRMSWVEGRIARGHHEFTDAERHFKQVAGAFARMGNGYDAALASLDLAELFLTSGESPKLRAMARGVGVILESEDLHRKAATAILLFQKALAEEQISRSLIDHVRGYLEVARNNPALSFEPSS